MRILYLALLNALLCGCAVGTDSLEARVRNQDERIHALREELAELRREEQLARHEASVLRAELADPDAVPRAEQLAAGLAVQDIRIQSMVTGLLPDGRLHAVLSPVDEDGDVVKLSGTLSLRVLNLAADEDQQVVGDWSWSSDETRELWVSGALASGYAVDLPLPNVSDDTELLLHVRFQAADGRQFDDSQPIAAGLPDA